VRWASARHALIDFVCRASFVDSLSKLKSFACSIVGARSSNSATTPVTCAAASEFPDKKA
jgi:hypothetical protein